MYIRTSSTEAMDVPVTDARIMLAPAKPRAMRRTVLWDDDAMQVGAVVEIERGLVRGRGPMRLHFMAATGTDGTFVPSYPAVPVPMVRPGLLTAKYGCVRLRYGLPR